jgi:hypothetical protein
MAYFNDEGFNRERRYIQVAAMSIAEQIKAIRKYISTGGITDQAAHEIDDGKVDVVVVAPKGGWKGVDIRGIDFGDKGDSLGDVYFVDSSHQKGSEITQSTNFTGIRLNEQTALPMSAPDALRIMQLSASNIVTAPKIVEITRQL